MKKTTIQLLLASTAVVLLSACGGGGSSSNKTSNAKPIVIIGPSTVYIAQEISNAHYPDGSECKLQGWGEKLSQLAKKPNTVFNFARPGSGAGTFRLAPHQSPEDARLYGPDRNHYWAKTKEKMQALNQGILLIQFGGNDPRHLNNKYPSRDRRGEIIDYNGDGVKNSQDNIERWKKMYSAFKQNLKFYIAEADQLGFTPVLITSPDKRIRRHGEFKNNRGDWPKMMQQVAQEENVRLLDLHKKTLDEYNKHSDTKLDQMFGGCINGWSGHKENTHYDPNGARLVAGWIKDLACEQSHSELCQQLK